MPNGEKDAKLFQNKETNSNWNEKFNNVLFLAGTGRVTWTEGHIVDGPGVAVDLLKGPVAAGVPDGDGAVFGATH